METFSQFAGGFNDSPSTPKAKKDMERVYLPINSYTIQTLSESEEKITVGAETFNQVYMVGTITKCDREKMSSLQALQMIISDGVTDLEIPVTLFNPTDRRYAELQEGQLVRVYGRLRVYQGKHSITNFRTLVLHDNQEKYKEVHQKEVEFARLWWEKDMFDKINNEVVQNNIVCNKSLKGSMFIMYQQPGGPQPSARGNNQMGGAAGGRAPQGSGGFQGGNQNQVAVSGISNPLHVEILGVMERLNTNNEAGIHRDAIFGEIKNVNHATMRNALEYLCNEGHIYTTIDEFHYNKQ